MSIEQQTHLTNSGLNDCKRKLFTNSQVRVQQVTSNNNLYYSGINKPPSGTHSKQSTTKKIKLKGRIHTEMPITPLKKSQIKQTTSPNMTTFMRSPLEDKPLNIPRPQRIKRSQFYSINETQEPKVKRFTSMFSEVEVLPSPQKKSLHYSRVNKSSVHEQSIQKSQQRKLQKSKKKIHFTVYQSKEKSSKKSPTRTKETKISTIQYSIPYRYNSTIAIDLFSNSKQKSGSKAKSRSKEHRFVSPARKPLFNRDLKKSCIEQENQDKIQRTMVKLQKYRFVQQYIEKWEIMEKIQHYIIANEPQCKWPLLIVDHIFDKIKHQNNF